MRIHFESVAAEPGASLPIAGELDFSFADLGRGQGFRGPVSFEGVIHNRAGVVLLDYDVHFTLALCCDRCLTDVRREGSLRFSHLLTPYEPDEDSDLDAVFCPDALLDMAVLAVDDIIPSLPQQSLCSPDCKGLCPICGADRNQADCGHEEEQPQTGDPRWAALKNLELGDEN